MNRETRGEASETTPSRPRRRSYACVWCGKEFVKLQDKLIHSHKAHIAKGTPVPKRPTSCWCCATELAFEVTHCPNCGWEKKAYGASIREEVSA